MVQVLPLSDLKISWSRQEDVQVIAPEEIGKKANTARAQTVPEETDLAWQRASKDYMFQACMS